MRQLVIAISTVLLILSAAQQARAAAPPLPDDCSTGREATAYKAGNRIGENLARSAWIRVNDCDRIEYFLQVVEENVSRLTLQQGASRALICRYTGVVDGVYNVLDQLYGTCSDQCFVDGTFAGQLSAEVYCELSIALGGLAKADDFLRGPVQICGLNFEVGCDSQFISVSSTFSNPDGACNQFTQGRFFEVWDQARNNQCAYDPDPNPAPVTTDEESR